MRYVTNNVIRSNQEKFVKLLQGRTEGKKNTLKFEACVGKY